MAMVMGILSVVGGVISAYGAIQAAQAKSTAANFNAQISDQASNVALSKATADAALQQRQAEQVHGSLIANFGAAGVTMEGTPTDLLRFSVQNASLDKQNILYTGRLKSIGHVSDAVLSRFEAKTATEQGQIQAASSILTSAGAGSFNYVRASRGFAPTSASLLAS